MTDTAFHQEEDTTQANLEALGGNQNASSPAQGPPPEGALGAPASAGSDSPQLAAGQTYFDIYNEAEEEDKIANLDAMEESLGSQGTGVIAKTNEIASNAMAEKDGKTLNLLLKWGWKPREEQPSFDPASMGEGNPQNMNAGPAPESAFEGAAPEQAGALEGPPEEMEGPPTGLNDEQVSLEKKGFDRKKMGGFLMELGLNILASNRDDAGAALGDAFGKTRSDRTERKKVTAAENLAKSELERKTRREDEADLHKREKAARDEEKGKRDARNEKRNIAKDELGKLELLQKDDGTYEYVNKELGAVYSEDGKYLRGTTKSDSKNTLTVAQERIERRHAQDRLDDMIEGIKVKGDTEAEEALGYDPTDDELTEFAISRLSARDQALLNRGSEETLDYGTLD